MISAKPTKLYIPSQDINFDQTYLAASDGFVTAYCQLLSAGELEFRSGETNPPAGLKIRLTNANNTWASFSCPVQKGYYFKISATVSYQSESAKWIVSK